MILSPEYEELINRVADLYKGNGVTMVTQSLKLASEAGEVADAVFNWLGLNERKGVTHDIPEICDEYADVVMTALVGIRIAGLEIEDVLQAQAGKAEGRLHDQA